MLAAPSPDLDRRQAALDLLTNHRAARPEPHRLRTRVIPRPSRCRCDRLRFSPGASTKRGPRRCLRGHPERRRCASSVGLLLEAERSTQPNHRTAAKRTSTFARLTWNRSTSASNGSCAQRCRAERVVDRDYRVAEREHRLPRSRRATGLAQPPDFAPQHDLPGVQVTPALEPAAAGERRQCQHGMSNRHEHAAVMTTSSMTARNRPRITVHCSRSEMPVAADSCCSRFPGGDSENGRTAGDLLTLRRLEKAET